MVIIVDLDYTLLNSEQEISKRTQDCFIRAKKAGHKVIINSARSFQRSKKIAEKIDADLINCFYGNLLLDKNHKTIFSRGVGSVILGDLINDFKSVYSGWIGIETVDGAFGTEEDICRKMGAELVKEGDLLKFEAFKIVFEIDPNNPQIDRAKDIAKKYNLDVKFAREGYFCSFLPKDTNKWNGIKMALNLMGEEFGSSVAFGDEVSDLETFKNVDIAVAMKNSTPEILSQIENVTKYDNNQDGVAHWLEENLNI